MNSPGVAWSQQKMVKTTPSRSCGVKHYAPVDDIGEAVLKRDTLQEYRSGILQIIWWMYSLI